MRGEKENIKTSEKHRENKRERFPNTRYTIQSKGKATAESQSTTRNTRKHKTYAYNTFAYGSSDGNQSSLVVLVYHYIFSIMSKLKILSR